MLVLSRRVDECVQIGDLIARVASMDFDRTVIAVRDADIPAPPQAHRFRFAAEEASVSLARNETFEIENGASIVLIEIRGDKVRLGINAPPGMGVYRSEIPPRNFVKMGRARRLLCAAEIRRQVVGSGQSSLTAIP